MKKKEKRLEAIKRLKEVLKKGDTLFTQLEYVSKSGMMRHIKVRQLKNNRPLDWTYLISDALDWNMSDKTRAIKVGGCGMDMGFHLIYTLSRNLFNDGYAIKQEWL
jgi:hypothetical protein